jgi:putative endonuclease
MDRRKLGGWGETFAAFYLRAKGYRVLRRGWRAGRLGEIDLIAERRGMLVFVEVKTRSSRRFGAPEESLTPDKCRRLVRLVEAFLGSLPQQSPLRAMPPRIDVIAVERGAPAGWRVRHVIGAVDASGGRA